ncbi:D-alanyl-D-alanine carboxypeptidase family protein [Alkalicoccobacillus murimartini]|uniref:serine-type D-Ala-D-Ala carboxypeptidase n=1 Tax=Alkalicoccobacillus murimartini TaxID=171685 RepID=A0ABT9YF59_9BACI|nr:D-alanyl-D-alanine carboxypeptidase family protein [Alkalicoccobacillus murimartini]MDQ0205857.1 D-alanyl-D-alanine carboxypeptidase [Alkalicoccobacillus murimartini]
MIRNLIKLLVCVGLVSGLWQAPVAFAEPTIGVSAQAAVLMEQSTGRILYGKNEHEPMRIASITKIMTAILAIESGKLNETVTVSDQAFGTEGSSLYLQAGEKVRLEDLVYGLMMRSGNDAAVAIAEHVGGSLDGFVLLMNQKAEEIGMDHTLFENPHGLDDHENHRSSAYDMALLTQYAMMNDTFKTISGTSDYRTKEGQIRVFHNKNKLLTQLYKYSTGGKTGYTKLAHRTLVSTATKDELDLIVVTLDASSDWNDHMSLFNWAFDQVKLEEVVQEGFVGQVKDEYYKGRVYSKQSYFYPIQKTEWNKLTQEVTLLTPPIENERAQDPVGKLTIKMDKDIIASIPLYYDPPTEEEKRSFWQRLFGVISVVVGVSPHD